MSSKKKARNLLSINGTYFVKNLNLFTNLQPTKTKRSQNRQEMWGPEAKRPTEMGITLQSPPPPTKTVSNHVLINRRKDIKNRTPSTKCLLLDVVQKKGSQSFVNQTAPIL